MLESSFPEGPPTRRNKYFKNRVFFWLMFFPGYHCSHKIHCITVNCWHCYSLQTTFGFAPSGRNCLPLTLFRWVLFTTDIFRQLMLTARHFLESTVYHQRFSNSFYLPFTFSSKYCLPPMNVLRSSNFLYHQAFSSWRNYSLPTFSGRVSLWFLTSFFTAGNCHPCAMTIFYFPTNIVSLNIFSFWQSLCPLNTFSFWSQHVLWVAFQQPPHPLIIFAFQQVSSQLPIFALWQSSYPLTILNELDSWCSNLKRNIKNMVWKDEAYNIPLTENFCPENI